LNLDVVAMDKNHKKKKAKKKFNLSNAIGLADQFDEASGVLGDHMMGKSVPRLFIPHIVNGTFALEVYLKCLYFIEKSESIHGHHLKKIYDQLTPETKRQVKIAYEKTIADSGEAKIITEFMRQKKVDMDWRLEKVLEDMSEAFIRYRYAFEFARFKPFLGYVELVTALRSRILELRPELKPESSERKTKVSESV
jgi:hypothetical protein